ncbi:LytTR family DNA-binding domain-containing protein [Pedobacter sp. ASV28]|uniref:LytR/AlgR family response regulator transcription factor n=1 Tax=Pedobacter sp. ASV28 TaxID=2795123 RepID=UPI0018ED6BD1|nr:LytTR family DNA-binding domain-containing protein [Pedobacter sp. ASV28]
MKIKCFVIDDEPYAVEFLSGFIERTLDLELVGSATDPLEALSKILSREIVADIIFLDIEMPKINGLDFAAQAGHLAKIVLVTGNDTQSLQAYELGVIDYLLKPVSYMRFTSCINRIKKYVAEASEPTPATGGKIALRHGLNNAITYVELKDITHVEASSNYCIVYSEKLPSIKTHISLSEMEYQLGRDFLRVHRSFIVNLAKIIRFFGNTIVIGKNTEIPLGKNYRDEFMKATNSGGTR